MVHSTLLGVPSLVATILRIFVRTKMLQITVHKLLHHCLSCARGALEIAEIAMKIPGIN